MDRDYREITIPDEINKKINTLNKTRTNRIKLSQRLQRYDEKWRVVFFLLNIEAVVCVVLSLITAQWQSMAFPVFSGVFSIYVILTQYFVSQRNYSERALTVHHHELDIEDLILKLKSLILLKADSKKQDMLDQFNAIMSEYQRILKNNENHDQIDNERREHEEVAEAIGENTGSEQEEGHLEGVEPNTWPGTESGRTAKVGTKKPRELKPTRDRTPDNIVLQTNVVLSVLCIFAIPALYMWSYYVW
ncbi:SLATT domain-containing protein [Alicyclobacillus sp. SO9]|uniref:SLATT domain-containing protein n=1 Tax=Alicyclobacillus sp. SO9 TaxID=2665646 RepID=UPI0018E72AD5|nr:SLATT domain-containing protein [Alicyclobacillus sp. SO9]QQE77304.1 SLATT domain-containing protein [Alicyclobacillus sp. SO9]